MTTLYGPAVAGTEFKSASYTGGSVPARFDAFLYKPVSDYNQLKLSIKLRIKMLPLPQRQIPFVLDADDKPFMTSPWTDADWRRFIRGAASQADMWNNKFWLVPPETFTDFDLSIPSSFPNQAWRPNIRCALEVDFSASEDTHRTIEVTNLNLGVLLPQNQNPGIFRSHALLYDSLDVAPWAFPYGPGPGQPARHFVIAHEIGHAIGLGHIGTILKTPLCQFAISANEAGIDSDWLTNGGRNSFYCYGHGQGIAIVGNIMGAGDAFTVENARPWVWAMNFLRGRHYEMWRAVTTDPGPGTWVKLS